MDFLNFFFISNSFSNPFSFISNINKPTATNFFITSDGDYFITSDGENFTVR